MVNINEIFNSLNLYISEANDFIACILFLIATSVNLFND